jgi:hypothetical protein
VEAKGEEKWKHERKVQNGMPMLKPCHLFLDCAFFFFRFSFRFSTDWLGDASCDFVACLVLLARLCMPGCRRERKEIQQNVWMFGRDGTEWNPIIDVDVIGDMYERSCVFRFCAIKKPKQQKTVEKGKISVFSLEWNCCCGG